MRLNMREGFIVEAPCIFEMQESTIGIGENFFKSAWKMGECVWKLRRGMRITPGGLGAVEAAMVGILTLYGITSEAAVAITVLDRLISYWSIIPLGFLTFVVSRRR